MLSQFLEIECERRTHSTAPRLANHTSPRAFERAKSSVIANGVRRPAPRRLSSKRDASAALSRAMSPPDIARDGQSHTTDVDDPSTSHPSSAALPRARSRQELKDLEHERALEEKVKAMNAPQRWFFRRGYSDTFLSGPKYFKDAFVYYRANPTRLKNEILSGLTVSLVYVPESVAFSFVANVDPIVGLYATFFMGVITALVGGRPGMVSGAAGAMAVVAVNVMEPNGVLPQKTLVEWGEIAGCTGTVASGCLSLRDQAYNARLEWLFMIMILCGLIQIALGVAQAGKLVRMIPQTVLTGFVNGLALIMLVSQVQSFKQKDWAGAFAVFDKDHNGVITFDEVSTVFALELPDLDSSQLHAYVTTIISQADADSSGDLSLAEFEANKDYTIHGGYEDVMKWRTLDEAVTWIMLFYVASCIIIVYFLPKLTKIIPSSLVAILWCLFFEHALNRPLIGLDTPTVRDRAPVNGAFPLYHTPRVHLTGKSFLHVLPISFSLAAVGLIESVLTLQFVDEILEDTSDGTGRYTQECVAQGLANAISGMFRSMGGDAMIGQSTINVKSGGYGRLSTTFAALIFLVFIVAASVVIELIPLAALMGVLFMIIFYTFDWSCIPLMLGDVRGLFCCFGRQPDGKRLDYAGRRKRACFADTNDRIRWKDSVIIILVTVVTVVSNLAIAVGIGVVVAAVFYAWDNSYTALIVYRREESVWGCERGSVRIAYEARGELFFGTDREFKNHFRVGPDPKDVVVYLDRCKIKDYSALNALNSLYERYADVGKTLRVHNTDPENRKLIDLLGAKFLPQVVDEDLSVAGVAAVDVRLAHAKRPTFVDDNTTVDSNSLEES